MKTSIATVSIPGTLREKLDAIATAGFDGIAIFEQDFIADTGTPREIVDRLNAEVSTILQSDALVALSERTGIELLGSTPEELDAYNKDQIDSYRVLIEEFDLANK